MEPEAAIRIGREALLLAIVLSAIPVIGAMIVGLVISLFQAATQIQEQTLTQVPKIVVVYGVLMAGGMWMLTQLLTFSAQLFTAIGSVHS